MIDTKKKSASGWPTEDTQVRELDVLAHDYTISLANLQGELDKKFTGKKRQTETLGAAYNVLGLAARSQRVLDCGSFLEFRVFDTQSKLQTANFCRDRLCPMCNWRRSLKIYSQVSRVMDELESKGYKFLFLTLTVRNCRPDELPATVQALYDGWRFLYNKNRAFRRSIAGTFRALEVTRNYDTSSSWYGSYHPHLHVILAVRPSYFKKKDEYITHKQWTDMWRSACDLHYDPIVHIQKVYLKDKDGKKCTEGIDLKAAVAEATKYAVKGSDYLNPEDIAETADTVDDLLYSLAGRRLCGWTGCFQQVRKALNLDDPEDGDLVLVDGDEIRDDLNSIIVRYGWKSGIYVRM